ncbi:MAG: methylated-DNA--[protein]-cysteine S-methyltransferase [Bryobacteraceae bacterium]
MLYCADLPVRGALALHIVASGSAVHRIDFDVHAQGAECHPDPSHPIVAEALHQLRAYFAGELREFRLPLAPKGTGFQRSVWRQLEAIPYGETCSYAAIAQRIGKPLAVRAVGAANGSNPLPIVVPCHRVIASNGKLCGFGGGLDVKRYLLDLEAGVNHVDGSAEAATR